MTVKRRLTEVNVPTRHARGHVVAGAGLDARACAIRSTTTCGPAVAPLLLVGLCRSRAPSVSYSVTAARAVSSSIFSFS